jgi:hypothetical protein
MSELDDLKARILKLERLHRLWLWSSLLTLALAVGLYLWDQEKRQKPSAPSIVEGETFVMKDAAGNVGGKWAITEKGPEFLMKDERGVERLRLGVLAQGPYVALQDEKGRLRVVLDATKPDGPSLCVLDEQNLI